MGGATIIYIIMMLTTVAIYVIYRKNKVDLKRKPFKFSYIALGLMVLNLILHLTEVYARMPENISNIIFVPTWFTVSIIGLIGAFRERKNNLFMTIILADIAVVSFIFSLALLMLLTI